MASRDEYKLLHIKDALTCINQRVNLVGAVFEFGVPRQSKGTDCFCTLKLIDESYQSPGFTVNVFAESMGKLPQVRSSGDIIQFCQVVIKAHHGEVYALFNKKFSSFALFEGKPNEDFTPYQVSLKFHMRGLGKDFITCLRTWLLGFRFDTGTRETMLLLREIHEGLRFDLVCKILHICELSKGEWMLFVWDGTDTPPLCFETKLEDEAKSPLPLQLEPSLLPRDILSAFPCVGTVLRVTVDQENEKLGLHLLDSGRWVKFINIICQARSGLWHGVLMLFTKIRLLANEDTIVKHREEFYKERVSSKLESMPLSCFPGPSHITETDYDDVRFATLMEVLTYSQVTAKFKCIVRIVATYPWQIEDFRSPLGIYRMRLTLEDPTARIHAYVYAEDGEKFFEGHPLVDVLKQKRNKLLGISERDDGTEDEKAPRNPPWVQCCIKSYYIDKSDAWGSRRYRIFATRMVG
ncbi:PREDICTED: protection of telomeres protein 1b-like [Nelumbo nucifera]|uniref:Protection of telomeres protein 1b-like n=2 Tax=Nelumbo nucifera TaxID=4432 RepID=A0A1U8BDK9_NELNU|nr:PREDICTED: protection of telomeres protein 1b-like [Nelumbo nucifera]DAD32119.1 TPA_asm: hypothetical protein HUJ06_010970 [Nelumbo nucifera]